MASENDSFYRRRHGRRGRESVTRQSEYRLYVGDSDTEAVADVVAGICPGATVVSAVGIWEGEQEATSVVTILTDREYQDAYIEGIALRLRERFKQECVLVTRTAVESTLV